VLRDRFPGPGIDDILARGPATPGRENPIVDTVELTRMMRIAVDGDMDPKINGALHIFGVQIQPWI
jgi:hypothetical protein